MLTQPCLRLIIHHSSPSASAQKLLKPQTLTCLMPAAVLRNKAAYKHINSQSQKRCGTRWRTHKKKSMSTAVLLWYRPKRHPAFRRDVLATYQTTIASHVHKIGDYRMVVNFENCGHPHRPASWLANYIPCIVLVQTTWHIGPRIMCIFTRPLFPPWGWGLGTRQS